VIDQAHRNSQELKPDKGKTLWYTNARLHMNQITRYDAASIMVSRLKSV
jgi:hypothetical protein